MTPVLLIAENFLREQRWLTLVLILYAVGGAAAFGIAEKQVSGEDVLFFLHQQALYSVLFSYFLAVSAINNERKSRRMLAVLSKAITRGQYLAGLLVGILAVFGIYCVAIGVSGMWMVLRAQSSLAQLWVVLGITAVASLLVSAVALFFTTFLTPLFATVATAITLGIPVALEQVLGSGWGNLLPVYSLATQVSQARLRYQAAMDWRPVAIAIVETIILWILASWIFAARDVTVAVE